eukprot:11158776-Lingulodinium_polyedra.AAC.1
MCLAPSRIEHCEVHVVSGYPCTTSCVLQSRQSQPYSLPQKIAHMDSRHQGQGDGQEKSIRSCSLFEFTQSCSYIQ